MRPMLITLFVAVCVALACANWTEEQRSSVRAANEWLAALETGNADALWEQSSELTKARFEKEMWTKLMIGSRSPFGALHSRELDFNWKHDFIFGFPEGDYREVGYSAEFAKADYDVDESVFLSREDGTWKVIAYEIDRPRWRR